MKITIASRIFSPEPAAASFRLAALADALQSRGNEVTVLTVTDRDNGVATTHPRVRVRRAPVVRDSNGYVRGYIPYLSFDIPLFVRVLLGKRADVLCVEPPPTSGAVVRVAAVLRRIPYVYYAADVWSDAAASAGASRLVTKILRQIERFAMRGAQRVVAVSEGVAERVRDISGHDDVVVIPNGVDTTIFNPNGERLADAPLAVYTGTTSEWQGADVFIRAFPRVLEKVPDAKLHFIGQGSAWAALRALARDLAPAQITFTPTLPPEEAAVHLRSARAAMVSLVPGQGYDFAVPTKILAAAASGTPVLFAGTGPSVEIIESNGLGRATGMDIEAVADEMTRLLASAPANHLRKRIARWAVENVSQASSAERVARAIEESA